MKALPKKFLPLTVFTIAVTAFFCVRPAQAFTVTLEQVGANVVATGSGAINLTGLTFNSTLSGSGSFMHPSGSDIQLGGNGDEDVYGGPIAGPTNFGGGGVTFASSSTGDVVSMLFNFGSGPGLTVPAGYSSGGPLSDSSTYNGATFASLGVTPGTYVWTWGAGANQRFTLIIGAAGVPDAGSTLPLLGCALLGLAALRRKLNR